ncbi:hypothetical protein NWO25_00945 [Enterococcus lactis]|nr:hypothetical protein [Enterococcus lactis]
MTIAVVTLLIVTSFPEFYIFAVGLILALVINYPDRKMQTSWSANMLRLPIP